MSTLIFSCSFQHLAYFFCRLDFSSCRTGHLVSHVFASINPSGCMVDAITFITQAVVFEDGSDSFLDATSLFVGLQRLLDAASLNS